MNKDKGNQEYRLENLFAEQTKSTEELQKTTWAKINKELFAKKNKRSLWMRAASMTAAILLLGMTLSTTTGQAVIQNIWGLFEEEKEVELNIEGQREITDGKLNTNQELDYAIYVDESNYRLEKEESRDIIVPAQELGERYPEVSMEIIPKSNTSSAEELEGIKQDLAERNFRIIEETAVTEPIEGSRIIASEDEIGNQQWDSVMEKYYITQDRDGALFVMKQLYFLEAEEGHGVRFDSMLESFEVVEEG